MLFVKEICPYGRGLFSTGMGLAVKPSIETSSLWYSDYRKGCHRVHPSPIRPANQLWHEDGAVPVPCKSGQDRHQRLRPVSRHRRDPSARWLESALGSRSGVGSGDQLRLPARHYRFEPPRPQMGRERTRRRTLARAGVGATRLPRIPSCETAFSGDLLRTTLAHYALDHRARGPR